MVRARQMLAISTESDTWCARVDVTLCVLVPRADDAALLAGALAGDPLNDLAERGDRSHALVRRLGVVFPNREREAEALELWVRRAHAPAALARALNHGKYALADFGAAADGCALWVWCRTGRSGSAPERGRVF